VNGKLHCASHKDISSRSFDGTILADNSTLMKSALAQKECIACDGGTPRLEGRALDELKQQLDGGWQVVNGHHLEKQFKFPDFRKALEFTNRVGEIAEKQGHHPDIFLGYGEVKLKIWTHKIDGLTESDFILAAKANEAS
jgi:4a-hydroxytetrahydrobiopterin dehydratase